ncbi:MAG: asparaginase domain-containing protein [Candidatus Diapherotrites archaeon]|nr:asparaginase domain-containing protein [Candidatus Diapherotrites archaeon]
MIKPKKDKVLFVLTGGTIDSQFSATEDTVKPLKESVIPAYLKSLRLFSNFTFKTLFMKDSRKVTYADRVQIASAIKKFNSKKIIVTHGTYTLIETARFLKKSFENSDQVIIVTGSLIPLVGFKDSDASFNLGFALACSRFLSPGVYVCMNGEAYDPENVDKQLSVGLFKPLKIKA